MEVRRIDFAEVISNLMQRDLYLRWLRQHRDAGRIPCLGDFWKQDISRHHNSLVVSEIDRDARRLNPRFHGDNITVLAGLLDEASAVQVGRDTPDAHRDLIATIDLYQAPLLADLTMGTASGRSLTIISLILPLRRKGPDIELIAQAQVPDVSGMDLGDLVASIDTAA